MCCPWAGRLPLSWLPHPGCYGGGKNTEWKRNSRFKKGETETIIDWLLGWLYFQRVVRPQSPVSGSRAEEAHGSRWCRPHRPWARTKDDWRRCCQRVWATHHESKPLRTRSPAGATHRAGTDIEIYNKISASHGSETLNSRTACLTTALLQLCVAVYRCYLWGDATVHQVLQQLFVMMSQNILHHAQDVQRRVGEVLEPMLTPIHCTTKCQSYLTDWR